VIIKSCLECKFHKMRSEDEGGSSYCVKEGCWAVYTNCITQKAVELFLIEECRRTDGSQILNAATQ
jgi:hypothetical protein